MISLTRYLENCRRIINNPGCPTVRGLMRHTLWHLIKRYSPMPLRLPITERSFLHHQHSTELNGCSALAWSQGQFDYHNMSFLRHITAQPGFCHTCLDIGANHGIYTLLLSEADHVHVHAFEPHPVTFKSLQSNLTANQRTNVTAWNHALSDQHCEVNLTDVAYSPMNQILTMSSENQPHPALISIDALRGDRWCQSQNSVPQVLKIDTEGHEAAVLNGFGQTLRHTKVVVIEENVPLNDTMLGRETKIFHGPWYVDFPKKRLVTQKFSHEDAVYCHHNALAELQSMGYKIPTTKLC